MADRFEDRRREPLPGLLELPGFLLHKLTPGRRRATQIGLVLVFLGCVAAAIVLMPKINDDKRVAARAEQSQISRAHRANRAQQVRDQRPLRTQLATGVPVTAAVERAVMADAKARAASGRLSDKPYDVSCERKGAGPGPGSIAFDCLAATSKIPDNGPGRDVGGVIGYPYSAVAADGRATICKVIGRAGEGGLSVHAAVPLARACGG